MYKGLKAKSLVSFQTTGKKVSVAEAELVLNRDELDRASHHVKELDFP